MTIALTLQTYLDQNVTYEFIPHDRAMTSMRTAEACHIPGDCLAKAIVLRRDGGYMLAVLPASRHIHFPDLRLQFGDDISLASEDEISGHPLKDSSTMGNAFIDNITFGVSDFARSVAFYDRHRPLGRQAPVRCAARTLRRHSRHGVW